MLHRALAAKKQVRFVPTVNPEEGTGEPREGTSGKRGDHITTAAPAMGSVIVHPRRPALALLPIRSLVLHCSWIVGYSDRSLMRASTVVNCQSTLATAALRAASQLRTSRRSVGTSGIRRSRH